MGPTLCASDCCGKWLGFEFIAIGTDVYFTPSQFPWRKVFFRKQGKTCIHTLLICWSCSPPAAEYALVELQKGRYWKLWWKKYYIKKRIFNSEAKWSWAVSYACWNCPPCLSWFCWGISPKGTLNLVFNIHVFYIGGNKSRRARSEARFISSYFPLAQTTTSICIEQPRSGLEAASAKSLEKSGAHVRCNLSHILNCLNIHIPTCLYMAFYVKLDELIWIKKR